jgi:SAM-dependent methyltransferase
MDPSLLTTFAAVERNHWWFLARREILLAVLERHLARGAAVLDVGCGTGFCLEALHSRYDTWGVDPSAVAVRMCHDRGLRNVFPGSATNLSAVADRRFGAALFLDVIEHLDDDTEALRLARELLAPGGIVVVTVPAFMSLWSHHDVLNEHRRRYVRRTLDATLRAAGFAIERLSYFNCLLFPFAAADRLLGRITSRKTEARLGVPPRALNRLMQRVFAAEKHQLVSGDGNRSFPFGLSLLAVGRKDGA